MRQPHFITFSLTDKADISPSAPRPARGSHPPWCRTPWRSGRTGPTPIPFVPPRRVQRRPGRVSWKGWADGAAWKTEKDIRLDVLGLGQKIARGGFAVPGHSNAKGKRQPKRKKKTRLAFTSRVSYGGERGIRTLETLLTPTRFPIVRLRPAQPSLQGTVSRVKTQTARL